MINPSKISQAGALRLLAALAVALLWLQACGPAVLAAPQRPPRSAESAQPSRPAATPVVRGAYVPGRPRSYSPGQDYSHCMGRPCAPKITPAPSRNGH